MLFFSGGPARVPAQFSAPRGNRDSEASRDSDAWVRRSCVGDRTSGVRATGGEATEGVIWSDASFEIDEDNPSSFDEDNSSSVFEAITEKRRRANHDGSGGVEQR